MENAVNVRTPKPPIQSNPIHQCLHRLFPLIANNAFFSGDLVLDYTRRRQAGSRPAKAMFLQDGGY